MTITTPILQILEQSTINGKVIHLPEGQRLNRETYLKVNQCLEAIGGKWDRRLKGHKFEDDPSEAFENMLSTGSVADWRKELQFFPTPEPIVDQMIDLAEIIGGEVILEPSAGEGAIADRLLERCPDSHVWVCEKHPPFLEKLRRKNHQVVPGAQDFLEHYGEYDRIIMNPPFAKSQDMLHIAHAFGLLKPGGILVSVCCEGPFFRQTKIAEAFRELVEAAGYSEKLPADSFAESGTGVAARLVVLKNKGV